MSDTSCPIERPYEDMGAFDSIAGTHCIYACINCTVVQYCKSTVCM